MKISEKQQQTNKEKNNQTKNPEYLKQIDINDKRIYEDNETK